MALRRQYVHMSLNLFRCPWIEGTGGVTLVDISASSNLVFYIEADDYISQSLFSAQAPCARCWYQHLFIYIYSMSRPDEPSRYHLPRWLRSDTHRRYQRGSAAAGHTATRTRLRRSFRTQYVGTVIKLFYPDTVEYAYLVFDALWRRITPRPISAFNIAVFLLIHQAPFMLPDDWQMYVAMLGKEVFDYVQVGGRARSLVANNRRF